MAPTLNKQNPPHLSIHHASYTANIGLISYALSSGVSANALLEGFTPLHLACASCLDSSASSEGGVQDSAQVLEAVKLLIGRGADVNAKRLGAPGGSSSAIATGKWKVGGVVGATPLHIALFTPHPPHILHAIVSLLLSVGADPTLRDKEGRRPSQIPAYILKQAQTLNKPTFLIPEEVVHLIASAEKTWMAQFPSSRRGGSRMNSSGAAANGSGRPGTSSGPGFGSATAAAVTTGPLIGTGRPGSANGGRKILLKKSFEGTFSNLNMGFRPRTSSNSSQNPGAGASFVPSVNPSPTPTISNFNGSTPAISSPVPTDIESFHNAQRRPSLPSVTPSPLPTSGPPISFSRALRNMRPSSAGSGAPTAPTYITTSQQRASSFLPIGPSSSHGNGFTTPNATSPSFLPMQSPMTSPVKKPSKYSFMGILRRTGSSHGNGDGGDSTTPSTASHTPVPGTPMGGFPFQSTKRPHTAPMHAPGTDAPRSTSALSIAVSTYTMTQRDSITAPVAAAAAAPPASRMMTPPYSDATPSPTPYDYGFPPPPAPPNSPDVVSPMNIQPLAAPRGNVSPTPKGRVPVPAYYPSDATAVVANASAPRIRTSISSQLPTPPGSSSGTSSQRASVVDNSSPHTSPTTGHGPFEPQSPGTAIGQRMYILDVDPPPQPNSPQASTVDLSNSLDMDSPMHTVSTESRLSSEGHQHPYRTSMEGRQSHEDDNGVSDSGSSFFSPPGPPSATSLEFGDHALPPVSPASDGHLSSSKGSSFSRPTSTTSEQYRKIEHELIDSYGENRIDEVDEDDDDGEHEEDRRADELVIDMSRSNKEMIISPRLRDPEDEEEDQHSDQADENVGEPEDLLVVGEGDDTMTIELDAPDYSSDMSHSDSEEEQVEVVPTPRVYDAEEDEDGLLSPRFVNYPFERNSLVQRKAVPQSHPYAKADPRPSTQNLRRGSSELSLVDEEETDDAKKSAQHNVVVAVPTPLIHHGSYKFGEIKTHRDAQELVRVVRGEILADKSPVATASAKGSTESGLSLSEQLARYGETLEIERRLREKEASSAGMNVSFPVAAATPNGHARHSPQEARVVEISPAFTQLQPQVQTPISAPPQTLESPVKALKDKGSTGVLKKFRRPNTSTGVVRRDVRNPASQGFPLVGAAMEVVGGESRPQTRAGYFHPEPTSPDPDVQVYHVLGKTIAIPTGAVAPPQPSPTVPRLIPRKPPPSMEGAAAHGPGHQRSFSAAPVPTSRPAPPSLITTASTTVNTTPFQKTSPILTVPPSDLVATVRARSMSSSAKLARMGFPPDATPVSGFVGGFSGTYSPANEKKKFGLGKMLRGITGRG